MLDFVFDIIIYNKLQSYTIISRYGNIMFIFYA